MPLAASILAAVIPMSIYLFIIWWMDKYEREPIPFVILHFFWGAVGGIVLAIFANLFLSAIFSMFIEQAESLELSETVVIAPIVEEIAKGLLLFATVSSKKFDNVTDGLVYGGAIGLGFGMTENAMYFIGYGTDLPNWLALVFIRSFFSAVMHCISTGTLGAFLASAKFSLNKQMKKLLPMIGLTTAVLIHFLWNYSVSFSQTYLYGLIFIIVMAGFYAGLFFRSIKNERKIIFRELSEEADNNIIPSEHLAILSSQRRKKSGWIKEEKRTAYIQAAVKLAFRKAQSKSTRGRKREFYLKEIDLYRNKVTDILHEIKLSEI